MPSSRFSDCPGVLVTESGAWVPVIDTGQITTKNNPNTTGFTSSLGKRTAFFRGNTPTTWSITGSGPWNQAQALLRLSRLPAQKFYWISPLGRHTNILPSDKPVYNIPLGIQAPEGYPVEVHGPNTAGNNLSLPAPIQPGTQVTASAYIAGGSLRIWWRTATGELIIGSTRKAPTTLGLVQITATAPENAATVEVVGLRCTLFASPAVRIGHDSTKFAPGPAGCGWVTLHDVEISHTNLAYPNAPMSISFTLEEIT